MDPLDIVNADCWRDIFSKLDSEDLLSISNTCHAFRRITEEYEFSQVTWKFDLILSKIIPYLRIGIKKKKNLLDIRLVCKRWCRSVDKLLSNSQRTIEPIMYEFYMSFPNPEKIARFQETFSNTSKNPIPSRSLRLVPWVWGNKEREALFISKALQFGEEFGTHIWNLQLWDPCNRDVIELLPHLPNLKVLHFDALTMELGPEAISSSLLPDLPLLEKFETCGMKELLADLILNKYGPQLKHLAYRNHRYSLRAGHVQRFKVMKSITITIYEASNTLQALKMLKSPLETLNVEIQVHVYNTHRPWEIDTFLQNVNHLPLKDLSIQTIYPVKIAESGKIPIADYINTTIVNLKMMCAGGFEVSEISLNFLEALSKLRNFEFTFNPQDYRGYAIARHPANVPEVVDLITYIYDNGENNNSSDQAYESNIWEKVGSLKQMKLKYGRYPVRKSVYTRNEYNAYRKRQMEQLN